MHHDQEQDPTPAREPYAEWDAIQAKFDRLGAAVAAALNAARVEGGGWTHTAHHNAYGSMALEHPRGWSIHASHHNSWHKGAAGRRLAITGSYPHGYLGQRAPEITVSIDRDPRAIAQDITRRFLPAYLVTARQAFEEERTRREEARARVAMNRRMEQALPCISPGAAELHEAASRTTSHFYNGRTLGRTGRAHASGTVRLSPAATHGDLKLTGVPAELILRILELLNASEPALTGRIIPAVQAARPELAPLAETIAGELISSALASAAAPPEPVTDTRREQPGPRTQLV